MSETQTKTNTMQKKKLTLKDSLQKWTVVQDDTFYNKLTLEKDYVLENGFEKNIKEVHQQFKKEVQQQGTTTVSDKRNSNC